MEKKAYKYGYVTINRRYEMKCESILLESSFIVWKAAGAFEIKIAFSYF